MVGEAGDVRLKGRHDGHSRKLRSGERLPAKDEGRCKVNAGGPEILDDLTHRLGRGKHDVDVVDSGNLNRANSMHGSSLEIIVRVAVGGDDQASDTALAQVSGNLDDRVRNPVRTRQE